MHRCITHMRDDYLVFTAHEVPSSTSIEFQGHSARRVTSGMSLGTNWWVGTTSDKETNYV